MEITLGDIVQAAERIRGSIWQTPIVEDAALSARLGARVLLKLECWQRTGSFKVRGAFSRIRALSAAEAGRGLLAVSAGNHAQGAALAAGEMGLDLLVVMPRTAPRVKREAVLRLGAQVELIGANYDEAEEGAREIALRTGRLPIHPFQDPLVIAGQGTVGLEIALGTSEPGAVLIPVGGGGLAVGSAVAIRALSRGSEVYGVQSEMSMPVVAGYRAGHHVDVAFGPSIADGLHGDTTPEMVDLAIRHLNGMISVSEAGIHSAMRHLYKEHRIVVEGSGAAAVAAVLEDSAPKGPLTIVITGRNVDPEKFTSVLMEDAAE